MQSQQTPSGQKTQWWQEKTIATSTPSYQETDGGTTSAPLELWDELEAEARVRAEIEQDAIRIEGNPGAFHQKRMRLAYGMLAFFSVLFAGMGLLIHHIVFFIIPLIFILEGFLLTRLMRKFLQQKHSYIQFSSLGMTAEIAQFRLGPVRWDEIESIQARSMMGMQYLKLKLKDPKATLNRALHMKNMPLKQFNNWALRLTPMEIMTQSFPISAKDIAAQIATIRPDLVKK